MNMSIRLQDRSIGRALVFLSVFSGLCVAQDDAPIAYVTSVAGEGAVRGSTGDSFPVAPELFSDEANGLSVGETIDVRPGGQANILFPEHGTVIGLGESCKLRLSALPVVDGVIPAALTLLNGKAIVATKPDSRRWLAITGSSGAGKVFLLFTGGVMTIQAGAEGVTFAVSSGEAWLFGGGIPNVPLADASGQIRAQGGVRIAPGESTSTMVIGAKKEIPGALSASANMASATASVYDFGLSSASRWVKEAERGDFTPVRTSSRGAETMFASEASLAGLSFDQPRTSVVTPASSNAPRAVQTVLANPVRALQESRRPTSVIIGSRLARTRIIGSPGTASGAIRVNPQVEPLIRLPR